LQHPAEAIFGKAVLGSSSICFEVVIKSNIFNKINELNKASYFGNFATS
jgi:hypothetical protein